MNTETLNSKLAEMRKQRQTLIEQAQYQLGAVDGQIALLEQMLSEANKPAEAIVEDAKG